jgi:ubiquinone/menaquinone biosynthesis C-methylase UbiE
MIASERSLIHAFRKIPLEASGLRTLDVGCGGGTSWYQYFCLGVRPQNMSGIDIQRERVTAANDLYPQAAAVHGDATDMPFTLGHLILFASRRCSLR